MDEFERFCADAHPQLVAALAHHFGDRFLAEDLAQEALVRAGDHWRKVSGLASPVGWAYRVGCNLGTSVMRRRGAERRALERRRQYGDELVHRDPDTPDRLTLDGALEQLPGPQRQAVIARYYLGLTAAEAAEALGTSAGAIRVRTHRAVATLRDQLGITLEQEHADVD